MEEQKTPHTHINLDATLYALSNVQIAFDQENFDFLFQSGNQAKQFRATPVHAKKILLLLQRNTEDYEKKFGEIDAKLPEKKESTKKEKGIGFGGDEN